MFSPTPVYSLHLHLQVLLQNNLSFVLAKGLWLWWKLFLTVEGFRVATFGVCGFNEVFRGSHKKPVFSFFFVFFLQMDCGYWHECETDKKRWRVSSGQRYSQSNKIPKLIWSLKIFWNSRIFFSLWRKLFNFCCCSIRYSLFFFMGGTSGEMFEG